VSQPTRAGRGGRKPRARATATAAGATPGTTPARRRPHIRLKGQHSVFDRFAGLVTRMAGSPYAFSAAVLVILAWACSGPLFGFSATWQLVVNTGTTIVTFLMVFLIQQSQNKDSIAIHLKHNELLASHEIASNRMIAIEDLDEEDLSRVRVFYDHLADLAEQEGGLKCTHSLDDAKASHMRKSSRRGTKADKADA
jgi:low affinity Fe/Cu permease